MTDHAAVTFRIAITVLCLTVSACATARTDFHPYSTSSSRAPLLVQAVEASESDVKGLAAAGAVIVGTVVVKGNGFAGLEYVREAAAREAARRGGTHLVLGMTLHKSARGQQLQASGGPKLQGPETDTYYPGRTIELTGLVLRLPEDADFATLPPPLRPQPDVHVARDALRARARPASRAAPAPSPDASVAHVDPLPEPGTSQGGTAAPVLIDGSGIRPLPTTEE